MMSGSGAAAIPAPPAVACELRVTPSAVAGQPVQLTVRLRNAGTSVLQLLTWGTPFEEGWFHPFVVVTHNGRALSYGGASVKRADPSADEYLRFAPGQRRQATLDLADVFNVSAPGRYVVEPRVVIHDVLAAPGRPPRPRAQHQALHPACRGATFEITPAR